MTAYDDPKVRERALAGPCVGYFRKTAPGSEILEAIRHGVSRLAPGS
jgi:DNA-binding NarL/FixJ family response regulator